MNRETILQIAKECGLVSENPPNCYQKNWEVIMPPVERFAHRMMAEGVKMAATRWSVNEDEYVHRFLQGNIPSTSPLQYQKGISWFRNGAQAIRMCSNNEVTSGP